MLVQGISAPFGVVFVSAASRMIHEYNSGSHPGDGDGDGDGDGEINALY